MRYFLVILFLFLSSNLYAQNVFNPVLFDDFKALDSKKAVDFLQRKLNPKFPKDTHIKIEDIVISGETFKLITFYYSEYDGATRGTSQYFFSFWKDEKAYLKFLGANMINAYDPLIKVNNNIITIKAYKTYEPLSSYYYSFIYKKPKFLFYSVMQVSTDADNKTEMKYYYSADKNPVEINSILADEFITK